MDTRKLTLLFICQTLDADSPLLAATLKWIETLALHKDIEHVYVLCLRAGRFSLPDNVHRYVIKAHGTCRIKAFFNFYSHFFRILKKGKPDLAFVYMAGPYPFLLLPWRCFTKLRVFMWKSHSQANLTFRLQVLFCLDKWLAINKAQAPFDSKKLVCMGQSTDTTRFRPIQVAGKEYDFIAVGRIAPIKRNVEIVKALHICRKKYGKKYSLVFCGDAVDGMGTIYKRRLTAEIDKYKLNNQVCFAGNVLYSDLPVYYNKSHCFVFACKGGVGKATLEAMACGIPVIIADPDAAGFFPECVRDTVVCGHEPESIAEGMVRIRELGDDTAEEIGNLLRGIVAENWDHAGHIESIVKIMKKEVF